MLNDFPDKKPFPETDQSEPQHAGNPLFQTPKEDEEQDLDELVHTNLEDDIKPNEEVDADDVIHQSITEPPPQPDTERDPDDLVHGH